MSSPSPARFLLSRLTDGISEQLLTFAVPIFAFRATGDVGQSGLAYALELGPRALALPVIGMVIDRVGVRAAYLFGVWSRIALALMMLALVQRVEAWVILPLAGLAALNGIMSSLSFVAQESALPHFVAASTMPRAQSALALTEQISSMLGPALGAAIAAWVSLPMVFGVGAVCLVVAAVNASRCVPKSASDKPTSTEPLGLAAVHRNITDGARALFGSPVLLGVSCGMWGLNLIFGLMMAGSAGHIQKVLAGSESIFGTMLALGGVASALCTLGFSRLTARFGLNRVGVASFFATCAGGVALGLAPSVLSYGACLALFASSCTLYAIYMRIRRQASLSRALLARGISFAILFNLSAFPLAGLMLRFGHDRLGYSVLLAIAAALAALLGAAAFGGMNRHSKRLANSRSGAPEPAPAAPQKDEPVALIG